VFFLLVKSVLSARILTALITPNIFTALVSRVSVLRQAIAKKFFTIFFLARTYALSEVLPARLTSQVVAEPSLLSVTGDE